MSSSNSTIVAFPKCPHCASKNVAFYYINSVLHHRDEGEAIFFYICGACGCAVCAEASRRYYHSPEQLTYKAFTEIYPTSKEHAAPKHTPNNVASDYLEALSSLQHENIKAACMMSRSAIETAVISAGANGSNLQKQIDDLAKKNLITQAMAEWAHEIRNIGNDAAHTADRGAVLTKQDAQDAVNFAEMLFTYLYTLPGQIAERRKNKQSD